MTEPIKVVRCLTCGFVLGTNVNCGPCVVEADERRKAEQWQK